MIYALEYIILAIMAIAYIGIGACLSFIAIWIYRIIRDNKK